MTERIESIEGEGLPAPQGPYSPAVAWSNLVFISGLLAVKPDGSRVTGNVREEAMVILRNLQNILAEAGSGLGKVLMVNVYLADINELPAFNEVYEEFFEKPYPARSAAGISLPAGFQVELYAVAFKG